MTGPAADLTEAPTGGRGVFAGESRPFDAAAAGYVEHEHVAAGNATSYRAPDGLPRDGRWRFVAGDEAPYRTRVLVRRPADPGDFSGTVLVEWLNVSGGVDGNPDFTSLADEITRRGHAWVGVSAQRIGVEGGPVAVTASGAEGVAGRGLKRIDPVRYGSLAHPGDGYAFDLYTQVARAVRTETPLLGGRAADVVLAVGESQSAMALVTYVNGVQPLTSAFDGFLVHSRAASGLPLAPPGGHADIVSGLAGAPALLRTDIDAPVLTLQTEGDLTAPLGSVAARQPDDDTHRLWEVAGAAHADAFLLGPAAGRVDCGVPVNDSPTHVVAKAALRALVTWVREGVAPPIAPRVDVGDGGAPEIRRDGDGIALGGIRTPPVAVPVDVLSSVPGDLRNVLCILLGSTRPLPDERLAALYSSRDDYLARYATATDELVTAGFALDDDRDALLAHAKPERLER